MNSQPFNSNSGTLQSSVLQGKHLDPKMFEGKKWLTKGNHKFKDNEQNHHLKTKIKKCWAKMG